MNSSEIFLAALPDGIGNPKLIFAFDDKNGFRKINRSALLNSTHTIVGYQVSDILFSLDIRPGEAMPVFIDISLLGFYFFGRPAKDFRKEVPWSVDQMLRDSYVEYTDLIRIVRALHGVSSQKISEEELQLFLERIANKYYAIKKEMITRGDWSAFENLEVDTFNIFLKSHVNGITIDRTIIEKHLVELNKNAFQKMYELRQQHGFTGVNGSHKEIGNYLQNQSGEYFEREELHSFLKVRKHINEKFRLLHELHREYRTKKILLRLNLVGSEKVHPTFDTVGTITGRILTEAPNLQIIQKSCRDVIRSDTAKELLYLDFVCYEPTILAGFSGDNLLKSLCISGDLYSGLSRQALGNDSKRDVFKVLFLAYSYGMEKENLIKLSAELLGIEIVDAKKICTQIFYQFSEVENWKAAIWSKVQQQGYSESICGNRRYRSQQGELTSEEKRWSVNQVIQGTGSVILKRSIIQISNTFNLTPLLPMHDALLFQVEGKFLEKYKSEIMKIMTTEFNRVFPDISIKIKDKPFFEENTHS